MTTHRFQPEQYGAEQPQQQPARVPVVILCAPSYDGWTQHASKWLAEVPVPAEIPRFDVFGQAGEMAEAVTLSKAMQQAVQTGVPKYIVIFCGHGAPHALLGPPSPDGSNLEFDGGTHSIIYDKESFEPSPHVLFAFCCSAASQLGEMFSATDEGVFLGYADKLPFIIGDEECLDTWKDILREVAGQIISDGDIGPQHEAKLKDLYDDKYKYYKDGGGQANDFAWLMRMYLPQHKALLRRYEGRGRA